MLALAFPLALALAAGGARAEPADAFTLSSRDFGPERPFSEKFVFNGMGCKGQNLSPALEWRHPPPGTKSYALMVHDPDAETGGAGIWHWVVVDIPATASALEQGAGSGDGAHLPPGTRQIGNDYAGITGGSPAWGGPCPPKGHGTHGYRFTLYALPIEHLELPPHATASHAGFLINRAALGKATLVGTYGR
jgi:hypothetical protein